MGFFNSGQFWFIEGILFCLVILGLKIWAEDRYIKIQFWQWIIIVAWIFLFGFSIAFVGTSIGENELTAAFIGGIIFGLISIVSAIGIWRWFKFSNNLASESEK